MKYASLVLCVLIVLGVGASAKAQCNCGMSVPYYAPPVHMHSYPPAHVHNYPPAHVNVAPPPRYPGTPMAGSTVAYVNKLATPVPRGNYSLNYAVHLADGRILLSDFLPPGHTARGIETQSGIGTRRLNAAKQGATISVTDPVDNSTVATFSPTTN